MTCDQCTGHLNYCLPVFDFMTHDMGMPLQLQRPVNASLKSFTVRSSILTACERLCPNHRQWLTKKGNWQCQSLKIKLARVLRSWSSSQCEAHT